MLYPWTSIAVFRLKFEMVNDRFLHFLFYHHIPWPHDHWALSSLKLKELTNLDAFLQGPSFFTLFSHDHVSDSGSCHLWLWNYLPWPGISDVSFSFSAYSRTLSEFSVKAIHLARPPRCDPASCSHQGWVQSCFTVSYHLFAQTFPYFFLSFVFHIRSLLWLLWSNENRPIKV